MMLFPKSFAYYWLSKNIIAHHIQVPLANKNVFHHEKNHIEILYWDDLRKSGS